MRLFLNHGAKLFIGMLLRSVQKSVSSMVSMSVSNLILNLFKFRSGKILTKKLSNFLLENILKISISHLTLKTYYPYAK